MIAGDAIALEPNNINRACISSAVEGSSGLVVPL
jgi:hypothetical protein